MPRPLKILEVLTPEERAAYEKLLRDQPGASVDALVTWLEERGYTLSRHAVWNHRKDFQKTLEDARQAAEMARAFGAVIKEAGVAGMNDAIISKLQQLQMQWAFSQADGGELTPEDLERFAKSLNQAASAAQRNEDLRTKFEEAMKAVQGKVEKKGAITAEDIAEVRKAVFG